MRRRCGIFAAGIFLIGGCERGMHDMYDQPKFKPQTPTTLFADGNTSRPQPAGTQPYGGSGSGGAGAGAADLVDAGAPPVTLALEQRGRDRFDIYCSPCHGRSGAGDGMVVRRGFPAPPSYHTERLRAAPDEHFFEVISNGYGAMYPYGDRISPADRWAIVAYLRVLQLSQHTPAGWLGPADRAALDLAP